MELYQEFWMTLWPRLHPCGSGQDIAQDLLKRYAQPQRVYHNLQHLYECIALFAPYVVHQQAEYLFFALCYHDAVYQPNADDNEQASAKLARFQLQKQSISAPRIEKIAQLILATQHHVKAPTNEIQALLQDIDLAILGADEKRFQEYQQQIRQEYAQIPDHIFYPKRRQILQTFLDRPVIYHHVDFYQRFENKARHNLLTAC